MTKGFLMNSLLEKMDSSDQDFRFMGLSDLMNEVRTDPNSFLGDEILEDKVLSRVLQLLQDPISEVKNQAVRTLGVLIKIIRETQMTRVIDCLIELSLGKSEDIRSISGLALKTITSELPIEGGVAAGACAKLTPKLLLQVQNPATPPETLIETLSTLSILVQRFPVYVASASTQTPALALLSPLLNHSRPAVRKRSIATISQFVPVSSSDLFNSLVSSEIFPNLAPDANLEREKTTVLLVAAITRTSASQIAPNLEYIVPALLKAAHKNDEELREGSLQALEIIVLKCPTEVTSFLPSIIRVGTELVKFDPNYAGDDEDEDDEMGGSDDDDDDDPGMDEYSDDEDASYKIRRSSAKLLTAVIAARPELLTSLYKDVSPVLISRFGDREETVKLEVWSTYAALLNQTSIYVGFPQIKDADASIGGKRKRQDDEGSMEVEETPLSLLRSQVPSLSKALLGQLKSPKTSPTVLQAGFSLLYSLLQVLPGSLSSQVTQIAAIVKSSLSQSASASVSTLHVTCLSFLSLFFATHSPPTYANLIPVVVPALLKSLTERHPRVVSESFRTFSALLNATKPLKSSEWVDPLYAEALNRISTANTDADVRASAEVVIGDLWICATDIIKSKGSREWEFICRTSGSTEGAVRVVQRVGDQVAMGDVWTGECIAWLLGLLRKGGRSGKPGVFSALIALLSQYTAGVPSELPPTLISQVKTYLTANDIVLLSNSLLVLARLLEISPKNVFPEVERSVLPDVYAISSSPLVSGPALEALTGFYTALVQADNQIASHVVPNLTKTVLSDKGENVSYSNVAKCISATARHSITAGTIAEFSKYLKSSKSTTTHIFLSLLVMGEMGKYIDMSPQADIFQTAIEFFEAEQEEVKTAAAFAAGSIAIGNFHQFLPPIVKMVKGDPKRRLLALHALKEVVSHVSHGQLEGVAETIWVPLFENAESSDETTRNVAAACLGKLTTTQPSRYLPQLHARIKEEDPAVRATVVSAIRYTFADTSTTFEELLSPLINDFLSLIQDSDLNVRRLALSMLNSAARTKPQIIRDQLPSILPILYKESVVNPALVRTVQMGPWTHKQDDGLEARKTVFETMYTLLDTCLAKLDLHEFLNHVLPGLSDDSDEIKVLSHMMLFRLAGVAPAAVALRLDEATPLLEKTMKGPAVTKDTVKQDLERASELQRSTLRTVAALSKVSASGGAPKFDAFVEELRRNTTWSLEFKELLAGQGGVVAQR